METTTERAGFGIRLGAYLIDLVIIVVLSFLLAPIIGGFVANMAAGAATANGASSEEAAAAAAVGGILGMIAGLVIAVPFLSFIYFLIEGFTGITLGKLVLGIKVATENAKTAPIGTLLTRYVVKASGSLCNILAVVAGIGFLGTIGMILGLVIFVGCFFVLGAKRQALHDMVAKTAVYKKTQIS